MRLVQFLTENGERKVARSDGDQLLVLADTNRVYDLALEANLAGMPLQALVASRLSDLKLDYDRVAEEKRLLPPLDHPDPAHCLVTGTGLTHLGSAQARDDMHNAKASEMPMSDSMRLFQWGLDAGKPISGAPDWGISVQPEWFYKGNGFNIVSPGHPLQSPVFALDGGEEAELVGLYVIAESGDVLRVGFALGNEFSDHVMEAQNYLYLAHSKLRACSFGPEILLGDAPLNISGRVRIQRNESTLWEETFQTGEDHMSYTIAALEHHHFKYEMFREPGDVHCHFFGTATLSRTAGISTQAGDIFEISGDGFGKPLQNTLIQEPGKENLIQVKPL